MERSKDTISVNASKLGLIVSPDGMEATFALSPSRKQENSKLLQRSIKVVEDNKMVLWVNSKSYKVKFTRIALPETNS